MYFSLIYEQNEFSHKILLRHQRTRLWRSATQRLSAEGIPGYIGSLLDTQPQRSVELRREILWSFRLHERTRLMHSIIRRRKADLRVFLSSFQIIMNVSNKFPHNITITSSNDTFYFEPIMTDELGLCYSFNSRISSFLSPEYSSSSRIFRVEKFSH